MSVTKPEGPVLRRASPPNAFEVLSHLLKAANAIRSRLAEFLEPFDLNEGRHAVLAALSESGEFGLSQSELAGVLAQSESNVSTLIERMQHDGLVDRLRSDADRRKWVLQLSPTGRLLLDRVEASRHSWAERIFKGFGESDRANLGRLMLRLDESLNPRDLYGSRTSNGTSSSGVSLDDALAEIEQWSPRDSSAIEADDIRTPHVALQEMLAALGLVNQLVEDEA